MVVEVKSIADTRLQLTRVNVFAAKNYFDTCKIASATFDINFDSLQIVGDLTLPSTVPKHVRMQIWDCERLNGS